MEVRERIGVPAAAPGGAAATPGAPARAAAPGGWRAAWAEARAPFLVSRLLVWAAGVGAVLAFGLAEGAEERFDPDARTDPFGWLGDLLVAPTSRWDSAWLLEIADVGYERDRATAFFPLYPLLLRVLGLGSVPGAVVAGTLLSLAGLAVALVLLARLVRLEAGEAPVRPALWLVALSPGAVFLSAVYTEGVFLALSVGAFWWARTGRWAAAAACAAAASATRPTGVLLLVPLAVLAWQARTAGEGRRGRDVAWLALAPAGLLAYLGWLWADRGRPLLPFDVQEEWSRVTVDPLTGLWRGAEAGWADLRALATGEQGLGWAVPGGPEPVVADGIDLVLLVVLLAGAAALVACARALPAAYTAYAAVALVVPLASPATWQPLMSVPRFLAVVFPLQVGVAVWAVRRGRVGPVLAASAALALWVAAQHATWRFVA